MSNPVLNARKRLERFGGENSPTNRKLRLAALTVAKAVCRYFPTPGEYPHDCFRQELPRSYRIMQYSSSDATHFRFICGRQAVTWVFDECGLVETSLDEVSCASAYQIARDIADGWLKEVAFAVKRCWGKDAAQIFRQDFRL